MKLPLLKIFFSFSMVLGAMSGAFADTQRWLTLADGLAGLTVNAICEDSSGLMWIATSNGVTLYNGVSMKNYELPRLQDGRPCSCRDICLDSKGNVWVAANAGVYCLTRYEGEFQRVGNNVDNAETILAIGDTIFVGARSGLFMATSKTKIVQLNITGKEIVDNPSVRCLREWRGRLWLSMRDCLYEVDFLHGMRSVRHALPQPSGLSRFDICDNRLFVGTKNNGLYIYDLLHPRDIRHLPNVGNVISDVHAYDDSLLCVAVNGGGALLLNAKRETILDHYGTKEQGNHYLPTDGVYTYIRTRQGLNWIGLYQNGFTHDYYKYHFFKPYSFGDFTTKGVKVTVAYNHGSQWLFGTTGGFWLVDEASGQHYFIDTTPFGMSAVTGFFYYDGYYYVGSYDGGLLRMDIGNHALSRLPDNPELNYASIHGGAIDKSGRLWVATSEGLYCIDHATSVQRFTETNSRLPRSLSTICFDQQGNGWIGSVNGLCLYLSRENTFKTEGFPDGYFNTLPGLKITGYGNNLLAWNQNQLYYTDSRMNNYGEIPLPSYAMNECIFNVLPNGDGTLWMTTEKGLFFVNPMTNTCIHLAHNSGLEGRVVVAGSLGTNNRYVWIDTDEGLMIAEKKLLKNLSKRSNILPMTLDYIFRGSQPMTVGEMVRVNDSKEIVLAWNFFSDKLVLMPVLFDYSEQKDNIYEYSFDDAEWHGNTIGEVIELHNLSLGRHTIKIRHSGAWASTSTYAVYVYPSLAFYLEIALLVLAIALLLWWYKWRRNTKQLMQDHVETERALMEELSSQEQKNEEQGNKELRSRDMYLKNRMAASELDALCKRMEEYVKTERPYLRQDLKMSDIASMLGVSPSLLSQVFTLHLKTPYYDYINRYRLEEFKRLIAEGKHKQYTVAAISELCGFKRTSFFSTFRKVEGITPTEYIQKKS